MGLTPESNMQHYGFFLALVAVLGTAAALWWVRNDLYRKGAESYAREAFYKLEYIAVPEPLPPLRIKGLEKGESFTLQHYKGEKLVLLNLWATWCRPCLEELPALENLRRRYKDKNIAVIAVSVDEPENLDKVAAFLSRHGIGDVAQYHDFRGDLQKALPYSGLPVTFLIHPKGHIMYRIEGKADWDSETVRGFLDRIRQLY